MNRIYDVVLNMNSLNSKPNAVDGTCLRHLMLLDVMDMIKQQKEVMLLKKNVEELEMTSQKERQMMRME